MNEQIKQCREWDKVPAENLKGLGAPEKKQNRNDVLDCPHSYAWPIAAGALQSADYNHKPLDCPRKLKWHGNMLKTGNDKTRH